MTTLFWILEYSKVLMAYVFLLFIWPSVVFSGFLKEKSLTFRFGFCATAQVLIINGIVLTLGLCHVLFQPVFFVLFHGIFLVQVYRMIPDKKRIILVGKRMMNGTYRRKTFFTDVQRKIVLGIKKGLRYLSGKLKGHLGEYAILGILLLFAMIYFTYGAFQDYSYGFGDMYPHNAWIYGLTQGKIFSAGVYPEGMHCFLYAMHTLFGIRIYSCLLFTEGIHVVVFLLAAYLFLKEVFCWKYTPLIVMAVFLTWDVVCIDAVYAMSRLQWTLPQEFALYTVFFCGAFLIRFLKHEKKHDLWVFSLALGASIAIHFYPTIMAFFICIAIVPIFFRKIFYPKRFLAMGLAAFLGAMIAVIPMLGALASGIPFQGSIGWALGVISGSEESNESIVLDENGEEITGDVFSAFTGPDSDRDEDGKNGLNAGESDNLQQSDAPVPAPPKESIIVRIKNLAMAKQKALSDSSYKTLYKSDRGVILEIMTMVSLLLFVIVRTAVSIYGRIYKDKETNVKKYDTYLSLILASVNFMCIYGAGSLGLPSLIAGVRVFTILHTLVLAVCLIPLDFLMDGFFLRLPKKVETMAGVFFIASVYVVMKITGCYHGYLYYELTRYNAAVMVTDRIVRTMPKNSFTIVSTVDELYQLIGSGYHEELVTFVNECVENQYIIPTEYVFIYIEKKPLQYAQSHFFEGPSWLAEEKYAAYYNDYVSQCPEISHGDISPEFAKPPFFRFPASSGMYSDLASRMILESRINSWCTEFSQLYPGELHTYYEDDDFVCYYFKQNPACLYQLGFQTREESEQD